MLSATYEITDIKAELKTYDVYDFAFDADFIAELTRLAGIVKREKMIPLLGDSLYDAIAAYDRTNLDEYQENIYYSEVYYTLAEFMLSLDAKAKEKRQGYTETRTQGGVNTVLSGYSGKEAVARYFRSKAEGYLYRAGYDVTPRMMPGGSIHA